MIDMLKRHAIQVLRRAGHSQTEIATLAGISRRSVQRVERESAVTHIDAAREREDARDRPPGQSGPVSRVRGGRVGARPGFALGGDPPLGLNCRPKQESPVVDSTPNGAARNNCGVHRLSLAASGVADSSRAGDARAHEPVPDEHVPARGTKWGCRNRCDASTPGVANPWQMNHRWSISPLATRNRSRRLKICYTNGSRP
jgi:hypothetical protein